MRNSKKLYSYLINLPGLVGYWPLNEVAGTVAQNRAGRSYNSNNGTHSGTMRFKDPGVQGGLCTYYNGTNSTTVFTGFSMPTTTLTVGMFVKFDGTQDTYDMLFNWIDAAPTNGWYIQVDGTDASVVNFYVLNGVSSDATAATSKLTSNKWYFLAFTYKSNDVRFFQNGNLLARDTSCTMTSATLPPQLARYTAGATNYLKGWIQHVFICNEVLSPTIIKKISLQAGLK